MPCPLITVTDTPPPPPPDVTVTITAYGWAGKPEFSVIQQFLNSDCQEKLSVLGSQREAVAFELAFSNRLFLTKQIEVLANILRPDGTSDGLTGTFTFYGPDIIGGETVMVEGSRNYMAGQYRIMSAWVNEL